MTEQEEFEQLEQEVNQYNTTDEPAKNDDPESMFFNSEENPEEKEVASTEQEGTNEDSKKGSSFTSFLKQKAPVVTGINRKVTIGILVTFLVVAGISFSLALSGGKQENPTTETEDTVQEMVTPDGLDGSYQDLAKYNRKPEEKTIEEEVDEDMTAAMETDQTDPYAPSYAAPTYQQPQEVYLEPSPSYSPPVYSEPKEQRDRNSPIAFFNFKTGGSNMAMAETPEKDDKRGFKAYATADKNFYNRASLERKLSPYELKSGAIIPAILVTGINSDLPGTMIAQVRLNVRDSRTGKYVLIPQGTKLIGTYNSKLTSGQGRLQVAWTRMIMPNGDSFDLDGAAGVDAKGMNGLTGKTNNHHTKLAQGAFWTSIFALGMGSLMDKVENSNNSSNDMLANNLSSIASNITNQSIQQQPTITIKQGIRFNVMVEKDMILRPYTGR